jgi:flagellar biosynthetic protein FliR
MSSFADVAGLALLLVRPGMIVIGTPFLGAVNAPAHARVGLTVMLAIVLAPFVVVPAALPATGLAVVVLREIAIGLALALAIRILMVAAEFAGHLAGYQIGLSLGSLIDPQSGVRNNVLALLYGNVTAVICLATNAHHALLRALADSYALLPIGAGGIDESLVRAVSRMLGLVFILGTRIAAPVLIVLLLVELALGLLARVAPSLNVMMAGAPVRLVVGLLMAAATITALPVLITRYVPTVLDLGAATARAFR